MNNPTVHCRCGHQVRAREVLRTDLYERASGQTYIYVKFRCSWCKRLGETFVNEEEWDWSHLDPARDEMTEAERQETAGREAITTSEVLDFHRHLQQLDERGLRQALGGFRAETDKSERARSAGKSQDRSIIRRPRRRVRRDTDSPSGETTSS